MGLRKIVTDFEKALHRLADAHAKVIKYRDTDYYEYFRDSSIQRFELCVELMWKTIKKFLEEYEGITCRSPKGCIRELFSVGLISQDDALKLLQMIDDRNMTVHTYHEEVAESIFQNLGTYIELMNAVLGAIKKFRNGN